MDTLRLEESTIPKAAKLAADALRRGDVVLYPTDTLYGLGVDARSDEAVAALYRVKDRDERKPVHAIVSDLDMVEMYSHVSDLARSLIRALPRGRITLVVPKRPGVDSGIFHNMDTFGFRIPDNDFCLELLRAFGGPITATSANKSGEQPPLNPAAVLSQLGEKAAGVNLVIDAGEIPRSLPSTVVDLSAPEPVILREGAIPASDVWEAVRSGY